MLPDSPEVSRAVGQVIEALGDERPRVRRRSGRRGEGDIGTVGAPDRRTRAQGQGRELFGLAAFCRQQPKLRRSILARRKAIVEPSGDQAGETSLCPRMSRRGSPFASDTHRSTERTCPRPCPARRARTRIASRPATAQPARGVRGRPRRRCSGGHSVTDLCAANCVALPFAGKPHTTRRRGRESGGLSRGDTRTATSAARSASAETSTCSPSPCAWSPTAPRPSSTRRPRAASRFPSEPPPTDASRSGSSSSAAACCCARSNKCAETQRSSGGIPVVRSTRTDVSGVIGRSSASCDATRSASATVRVRTSTWSEGSEGIVFRPFPRRNRRGDGVEAGGSADREDLMRELDRRVRAFLGIEPGMRGPSAHFDPVDGDALALGLQRAACARLERESRRGSRGSLLDKSRRGRRPGLLVGRQRDGHALE